MLKNKYRRNFFRTQSATEMNKNFSKKTIRDEHVKDKVQRIFRDVSENGEGASHMRKNTIGRFFFKQPFATNSKTIFQRAVRHENEKESFKFVCLRSWA